MGRITENEWQGGIDVFIIYGMTIFMEHGVHPVLVRLHVAKHPNVAGIVNIGAESVLVLAGFFIQVAVFEHVVDGKAYSCEIISGECLKILILVIFVEIHIVNLRSFLKKPVLVIPRPQFVCTFQVVILDEIGVNIPLHLCKSFCGKAVELIKQCAYLSRILVAEGQAHFVIVLKAKVFRHFIAQLYKLLHIPGNHSTDLFLGFPNLLLVFHIL